MSETNPASEEKLIRELDRQPLETPLETEVDKEADELVNRHVDIVEHGFDECFHSRGQRNAFPSTQRKQNTELSDYKNKNPLVEELDAKSHLLPSPAEREACREDLQQEDDEAAEAGERLKFGGLKLAPKNVTNININMNVNYNQFVSD